MVQLNTWRHVRAKLIARDEAPAKPVDGHNRLVVPDLGQCFQRGYGGLRVISQLGQPFERLATQPLLLGIAQTPQNPDGAVRRLRRFTVSGRQQRIERSGLRFQQMPRGLLAHNVPVIVQLNDPRGDLFRSWSGFVFGRRSLWTGLPRTLAGDRGGAT